MILQRLHETFGDEEVLVLRMLGQALLYS